MNTITREIAADMARSFSNAMSDGDDDKVREVVKKWSLPEWEQAAEIIPSLKQTLVVIKLGDLPTAESDDPNVLDRALASTVNALKVPVHVAGAKITGWRNYRAGKNHVKAITAAEGARIRAAKAAADEEAKV